jgi:hypothetical protein
MKTKIIKQFIILLVLVMSSQVSYSQIKTKEIFTSNEMAWYGLDFSNARFIGKFNHDFSNRPISEFELITKYIPAWNSLVIMEPHNFDLKNTFRKQFIYNDLTPVNSRNENIKADGIITLNSHSISKSDLNKIVSEYKDGVKTDGIGLTFVIESFDKANKQGNFWIVLFDIKTKLVLLSEHCSGEPVGFGLRNYWAGSIKHVLSDIRYEFYDQWKKKACKEADLLSNK